MGSNDASVKAILVDIEGTTTSISFVKDILFPYAREHVEEYLKARWDEDGTATIVNGLRDQSVEDEKAGMEGCVPVLPYERPLSDAGLKSVLKNVFWLMDLDRKVTPLKSLQGCIWKFGYDKGELKGHVFEDVPEAFQRWVNAGIKVYVYSSGSVQAQKLLFGQTEVGDLCHLLSGYFDTTTGLKQEADSYRKIAKAIELEPGNVLFCTDIVGEARAAIEAGMQVRVLLRPGNAPLEPEDLQSFETAQTFKDIL